VDGQSKVVARHTDGATYEVVEYDDGELDLTWFMSLSSLKRLREAQERDE
jgi:hypothetical protein